MARRTEGKGLRRSRNAWRSLLAKFDGSGLSVDAYCRREAIGAASFYRWRRLLGSALDGAGATDRAQAAPPPAAPAFVDLGTLHAASPPRPGIDLKLDLGDGLVLHLVRS